MEDLKHYKFSLEESRALEDYIQPCLAEFLGTTLYIAIACLSVLTNPSDTSFVQPALAHGLALGAFITTFGRMSGGHFNPAVSVAVFVAGGLSPINLLVYIVLQMVGGILGALLASSLKGSEGTDIVTEPVCKVGSHASVVAAFGIELVCSSILILIVLLTSVDDVNKSNIAPIAIAFFVTSAVLTSVSISGGCFNPARAFGPAVVWHNWDHHWIYWAGPGVSALLMSLVYRILLSNKSQRWVLFGPDRCFSPLSTKSADSTGLPWGKSVKPQPTEKTEPENTASGLMGP